MTLEKSGDGVSRSSLGRQRPKQQSAITASMMPAMSPGKKPTRKASAGNRL